MRLLLPVRKCINPKGNPTMVVPLAIVSGGDDWERACHVLIYLGGRWAVEWRDRYNHLGLRLVLRRAINFLGKP